MMTTYSKLWHLLSPEQRRSTVVLFAFMIFATLLETLGIGILVPAIALITQDHLTDKYPSLEPWLSILGNPSHEQLIIAGMLILVAVYAIKAVYLAFYAWKQAGFVSEIMANFSRRLFECYLNQSYTFHLQRNSAQLIQNTMGQVSGVTTVVANSQLLFTELLIVLGVSIMLVLIEPIGALLVMSIIGTAAWGFQRFTRGRILRWGKVFQIHEGLRIQYLQEGLGGAKDVKLLGRESNFLTQYNIHTTSSARIKKNQTTLLALPRLWLELLAVTGLAVLVLVMIGQGKPVQSILPTLGVFAVAAFRLMPSVTRILSSIQGLRFSIPMIDTVHSEFQLLEGVKIPTHGKPFSYKTILTLEHVNFRYPSTEANALDDINLSIYRGTTVGFIGGSGAGKSTLVDIILGLLTPANGKVNIDGTNIQTNLRGWQDQIGYVPQAIFLTDDSLRRNIAFGIPEEQIDKMAVCRAIHDAQLEEFINELPNGADTLVGERGIRLSGGQRQRIGIARALYHDPQVLVLDEATSSLDTVTEQEVMNAVQFFKGEKTIIIVAHRLSTVEQCDHLFHLEKGRIVDKGETAMILEKVAGATAGK